MSDRAKLKTTIIQTNIGVLTIFPHKHYTKEQINNEVISVFSEISRHPQFLACYRHNVRSSGDTALIYALTTSDKQWDDWLVNIGRRIHVLQIAENEDTFTSIPEYSDDLSFVWGCQDPQWDTYRVLGTVPRPFMI
ncbi:MAG: hypothetical protein ABEI13_00955 [Candidatus Paceibacteria bacterium]